MVPEGNSLGVRPLAQSHLADHVVEDAPVEEVGQLHIRVDAHPYRKGPAVVQLWGGGQTGHGRDTQEPGTKSLEAGPRTRNQGKEPGTWKKKSGTRNLEPGPETWKKEPGIRNQEPKHWNQDPGTRNLEPQKASVV